MPNTFPVMVQRGARKSLANLQVTDEERAFIARAMERRQTKLQPLMRGLVLLACSRILGEEPPASSQQDILLSNAVASSPDNSAVDAFRSGDPSRIGAWIDARIADRLKKTPK